MPTTVHIPDGVLRRLDARAKVLGVSRNRVILEALEASLQSRQEWPPELVRMLESSPSADAVRLFDDSIAEVRRGRTNRREPPKL